MSDNIINVLYRQTSAQRWESTTVSGSSYRWDNNALSTSYDSTNAGSQQLGLTLSAPVHHNTVIEKYANDADLSEEDTRYLNDVAAGMSLSQFIYYASVADGGDPSFDRLMKLVMVTVIKNLSQENME